MTHTAPTHRHRTGKGPLVVWMYPLVLGILVEELVVLVVAWQAQGVRRLGWWFLLVLGANLVTIPGMNAILVMSRAPSLEGLTYEAQRWFDAPWHPNPPSDYVPVLVVALEATVVAFEAVLYWIGGGLRALPALLTALAANAASFVVQMLLETV